MSKHLDESTRLTIRNTLLANPDLDLDAAMSTAISHVLSPLLAAYVDARVAEALAPVREVVADAEAASLGHIGTDFYGNRFGAYVSTEALRTALLIGGGVDFQHLRVAERGTNGPERP